MATPPVSTGKTTLRYFSVVRPPICEVCNESFSPREGGLVTCVGDEASAAFEERAEMPGFVGHPPNKGWFCPLHLETANHLASTETLRAVVGMLQLGEKQQICEICGIAFRQPTGGQVGFEKPTPVSEQRSEGAKRQDSERAWLCSRHINPALRVSRSLTRAQAMAELLPEGREPLEYDDKPASTDPQRDEMSPPLRGPFAAVLDGGLEGAAERWLRFAPHPPGAVWLDLRSVIDGIGAVFGITELRNGGSLSSGTTDPMDLRWAVSGMWVSSTVAPYHAGDVVVFSVRTSFRDGGRSGPIVMQTSRVLVQQREQSVFEISLVPSDPPSVAADGLTMIERALVRQSPALDQGTAAALEDIVLQFSATLSVDPRNPLDPVPDLVGVDLGRGEIKRLGARSGSNVTWNVGRHFGDVVEKLIEAVPSFLESLEVATSIELEHSSNRTWNPMDGASEPHCPFTDYATWAGDANGAEVSVTSTSNNWDEHTVANRSANLLIKVDGSVRLQMSVSDGEKVALSLSRPTSADIVASVRSVFNC